MYKNKGLTTKITPISNGLKTEIFNPNNDGEQIKLFFPPMTVEQRQESVKQMKGMGENAKVSIAIPSICFVKVQEGTKGVRKRTLIDSAIY